MYLLDPKISFLWDFNSRPSNLWDLPSQIFLCLTFWGRVSHFSCSRLCLFSTKITQMKAKSAGQVKTPFQKVKHFGGLSLAQRSDHLRMTQWVTQINLGHQWHFLNAQNYWVRSPKIWRLGKYCTIFKSAYFFSLILNSFVIFKPFLAKMWRTITFFQRSWDLHAILLLQQLHSCPWPCPVRFWVMTFFNLVLKVTSDCEYYKIARIAKTRILMWVAKGSIQCLVSYLNLFHTVCCVRMGQQMLQPLTHTAEVTLFSEISALSIW